MSSSVLPQDSSHSHPSHQNFAQANASVKTKSVMTEQSVVIVGGGHVGLSFALLLAYHGIASTLLEKNRYPTISPEDDEDRKQYLDSRNTALSRRTVQIYQEIGLWDELQSHACRIDGVKISEQNGFGKATLDKQQENVESFGQVMENAWLGRKLLLAVQKNPLIRLIDGAHVTDIQQNSNEVTLTYQQKDQSPDTLTASMLVACDGRDSTCRQLLGVGVSQYDYQQTGIVGVVQTDKPHEHIAIERFSPAGPLAVLPLVDMGGDGHKGQQDGYRRSVVWVCPKGEEQRYLQDDAYFLKTLQQAFGQQAGKFVAVGKRGAYPLTKVLAERQVVGRCVIMGNAAHTLHPVAGQGFNLCMRDAHVLAKMLANQVMRGDDMAAYHVLKQYETARKKDQKRVERFCDLVVFGFTQQNPALKMARNVGLLAFDKLPYVKPLVANYAMGLKS